MFKHANTFAPGDRVRHAQAGEKSAAVRGPGTVKTANDEAFEVHWDDGSFSWHPISELVRS